MRFTVLSEWLDWLNASSLSAVDLAPGRFEQVAKALSIGQPTCPVVTVAGTNGKGSVVTLLDAILTAQGYRVATYTSPYLIEFNEQITFAARRIAADDLCRLFAQIDAVRGETPLTLYEFKTLAALLYFQEQAADIWLLEVGMGGRLDPVNYIDADVAVITSIGLDHCRELGYTRAEIAKEKAGIFRQKQRIVCGDRNPPSVLFECAEACHAQIYFIQKDFDYELYDHHWNWRYGAKEQLELPHSLLLPQNAATALMVVETLQNFLVIDESAIRQGLKKACLPGRLQVIESAPMVVFDVAHNEDSVKILAQYLKKHPVAGETYAVFSMLKDRDIAQTVAHIQAEIDHWHIAKLSDRRAASIEQIQRALRASGVRSVQSFPLLRHAFVEARQVADANDRVVVFGSFNCISSALEAF